MTDPDLSGHSALITGSTGGLGLAIAARLAASGCDLVLNGLEPEATLLPQLEELSAGHGSGAVYVQADLGRPAEVERLAAAANAAWGGIDILINNAVVRHFAPLESFPTDAWDRALAVNLSAAFHAVRLLLPGMRAKGWGRVINMTSVYGARGTAGRVDYVTTKSALIGFTRAVAMETLGQGITCNAVSPGSVRTPAIDARLGALVAGGLSPAEAQAQFLEGKQPTGEFVEADDVAAAIAFLLSDAARDITGTVLPIDGGWLAG